MEIRKNYFNAIEQLIEWYPHIKECPPHIPKFDNIKFKRIRNSTGSCENSLKDVKDMIERGHKLCAREWGKTNDLLEDLHFCWLDKLSDATPPNLMLDDVEQQCDDLKRKSIS